MVETRARDLATSLGQAVKLNNITTAGGLSVSGLTTYTTKANLPSGYDSDNAGSLGFTTDSDKLYIHTGQGWFNVGIINTTPVWDTQPSASYALATDATAYKNGTATNITLKAHDSEGMSLTWTYTADTAFNNMAYIELDSSSDSDSKWIIEPKSQDSAGAAQMPTGSVTFKASDGINIATASSDFTLLFDTSVANSEQTVLLTKAIGDDTGLNSTGFDDVSDSNHTVTGEGNPTLGTLSPYNSGGYGTYFDGTGDYFTVTAHADFALNAPSGTDNDFTIEMWIYKTKTSSNYDGLLWWSNSERIKFQGADNKIYCSIDNVEYALVNQTHNFLNKWSHLAVVREGTSIKTYVNGALHPTTFTNSGTPGDASANLVIGFNHDTTHLLGGYLSDIRIVKGKAVYTGNFTPPSGALTTTGGTYPSSTNITNPTASETKLLICGAGGSGNIKDRSTSATKTIASFNGDVKKVPFSPFKHHPWIAADYGGSVYFDGNDQITVPTDADFDMGTGAFTVEAWIYPTNFTGSYIGLWDWRISGELTPSLWIYQDGTAGKLVWYAGSELIQGSYSDAQSIQKNREWYHIALSRTSNTTRLFVNGVETGTTYTSAYTLVQSGEVHIGAKYNDTFYYEGYMADVRFVKGHCVYTGNFTPPSGPLTKTGGTYPSATNISNPSASQTVFLLNNVEAKILDNSGSNNLRGFGNVQSDTGNQKHSVPAILFDGTGDYIETSPSNNFIFKAEDFTMEAWIYISDTAQQTIMITGASTSDVLNLAYVSGQLSLYDDSTGLSTSGGAISQNTWTHVAAVRKDGKVKLYVGGTQGADVAYTTSTEHTKLRLGMHLDGNNPFTGSISDARVTNGIGRYPFISKKETLTTATSFQGGITVTGSNTKLLTCHAASITDSSANGHTVTAAGNAAVNNFAPAGDMKSVYFDGTGDYLSTGSHADFTFGTGAFTIEFWVYVDAIASGNQCLVEIGNNDGVRITTTGSSTIAVYGSLGPATSALQSKTWYHIALARTNNGTDGASLFVNGAWVHWSTVNRDISSAEAVYIGARHDASDTFTGYISNLRIQNQAIYSKNFTPPSAALTG